MKRRPNLAALCFAFGLILASSPRQNASRGGETRQSPLHLRAAVRQRFSLVHRQRCRLFREKPPRRRYVFRRRFADHGAVDSRRRESARRRLGAHGGHQRPPRRRCHPGRLYHAHVYHANVRATVDHQLATAAWQESRCQPHRCRVAPDRRFDSAPCPGRRCNDHPNRWHS